MQGIFFTINRQARKIDYYIYGEKGSYTSKKYHEFASLPTFRLPDDDMDKYALMSRELQQKISLETGWSFDENIQQNFVF